jgi:hypothetical protein
MSQKSTILRIQNLKGECISESVLKENKHTLDLSFLQKGDYLIKLITPKSISMQRYRKRG